MKKFYFVLILLFISVQGFNQEKEGSLLQLDSLIKNNILEDAKQLILKINKDSIRFSAQNKAKYYHLLAKYYEKEDREELAYKFLKKASDIYQQKKQNKALMEVYFDIADLLNRRTNLKKDAKGYIDKIYRYAQNSHDTTLLSKAYFGYALLNFNKTSYKKAFNYYKKIIQLSKKQHNIENLAKSYNNIANIFSDYSNNQDSARYYYKKSIDAYQKLHANREKFAITLNLGATYKEEKNYPQAFKWFQKADSIPLNKYRKNYKSILYGHITDTYEELQDYKNALAYLKLQNIYKDSVNMAEQNIAITGFETKYKAIQKEKENIQLKAEKKQRDFIIFGILGAFVSFGVLGLLLYRNLKQKKEVLEKEKEIEHQKVMTLLQKQEILAMDAMLEGQEKERLRLAEDLHDNLGSSIATLKMQFDSFKNLLKDSKNGTAKALEKTSILLDDTYQKVRYMAHTNHASVMEKQGLITALKLLVQKLSDAKKLHVELNYFGFDKKINPALELTVFRIIQEILTNIIKHAKATEIHIDINLFEDVLSIIIEDNGKGFDVEKVLQKKNKGMGIQNLINRVQGKNGNFSIDSQIGKGTTIIIEIPVNNEIL